MISSTSLHAGKETMQKLATAKPTFELEVANLPVASTGFSAIGFERTEYMHNNRAKKTVHVAILKKFKIAKNWNMEAIAGYTTHTLRLML